MADYAGAGHWQLSKIGEEAPVPPNYIQDINLYIKKARFSVPYANLKFTLSGASGKFIEVETGDPHE